MHESDVLTVCNLCACASRLLLHPAAPCTLLSTLCIAMCKACCTLRQCCTTACASWQLQNRLLPAKYNNARACIETAACEANSDEDDRTTAEVSAMTVACRRNGSMRACAA